MTHDHSTRNAGLSSVVNPSWRAVVTSYGVVALGPLLAMVVYSHPMLAVGGLAGLLARPALALLRRVTRQVARVADRHSSRSQVAASGASVNAGGE